MTHDKARDRVASHLPGVVPVSGPHVAPSATKHHELATVKKRNSLTGRAARYTMVGAFCAFLHNMVMILDNLAGGYYLSLSFLSFGIVTIFGYLMHARFTFMKRPSPAGPPALYPRRDNCIFDFLTINGDYLLRSWLTCGISHAYHNGNAFPLELYFSTLGDARPPAYSSGKCTVPTFILP